MADLTVAEESTFDPLRPLEACQETRDVDEYSKSVLFSARWTLADR